VSLASVKLPCHILVELAHVDKGRPFRDSGWLYLVHLWLRVEHLFGEVTFSLGYFLLGDVQAFQ
jgi:hypothetical protein